MVTPKTVGAHEIVQACGGEWRLAHVGPGVRAKFAQWAKFRAVQQVIDQKTFYEEQGRPDLYHVQIAAVNQSIAAGDYNWDTPLNPDAMGPGCWAAFNSVEGRVQLVKLLLQPAHPKVTTEETLAVITANPEGVGMALRQCLGLSPVDGDAAGGGDDPNATAPPPAGAAGGGSTTTTR